MYQIFRNFIEGLSNASDAGGFHEAMAGMTAALELSCFAYLSMPSRPKAGPTLITNYPSAWTSHYLRHRYQQFDPVVLRAHADPEPFGWGIETAGGSQIQRQIFAEAADFGICYGFTIPIHDEKSPIATVTFATDEARAPFRKCVTENARVLQLMAMYFHTHVRRTMADQRLIGGVSLSPREFECLEWAARGKSAWEIGCILGISRRTAAFHLDNAKAKFGVRSISQAVARLIASRPI